MASLSWCWRNSLFLWWEGVCCCKSLLANDSHSVLGRRAPIFFKKFYCGYLHHERLNFQFWLPPLSFLKFLMNCKMLLFRLVLRVKEIFWLVFATWESKYSYFYLIGSLSKLFFYSIFFVTSSLKYLGLETNINETKRKTFVWYIQRRGLITCAVLIECDICECNKSHTLWHTLRHLLLQMRAWETHALTD